jgi:alkanesulfonate monooxygenase
MQLGVHIADFTWTGGRAQLGQDLARLAKTAEDSGVSRLTVMDHLWQIALLGPPEQNMLEAYTTLGYVAAHTEKVLLHTLVTGVVYREPGLLAKAVTTLDVLSGGRAGLGIGAAWNEEESRGLGLLFPPTAERFERLEEAIQICLQMWSESDEPYHGAHYRLQRTLNSPQNLTRPRPMLMIGGGGERKTLRLVARYADACNISAGPDAAHKLHVLREHCEREGRSYDSIEKTTALPETVTAATNPGPLLEQLRDLHELGFTVAYATPAGTDPVSTLGMLADHIIPAISAW